MRYTQDQLKKSPTFMTCYLGYACEIEYAALKYAEVLERLKSGKAQMLTIQSAASARCVQRKKEIQELNRREARVQPVVSGVFGTAVPISIGMFIGMVLLRNSLIVNAIAAVISLGNSGLLLLESLVILPLIIAYAIQSFVAEGEAESTRKIMRRKISGKKAELAKEQAQMRAIEEKVLPYYQNMIGQCESQFSALKRHRSNFYRYPILHAGLQNFQAVATMYTFFAIRRSTYLEGHGGAIDKYMEYCQRDQIIKDLEGLRRQMSALTSQVAGLTSGQNSMLIHLETLDTRMDAIGTKIAEACTEMEQNRNETKALRASMDLNNYYERISTNTSQHIAWVNGYIRDPAC